jgi:hypothetical protein
MQGAHRELWMTVRHAAPRAGYPQATRQPFFRSIKRFASGTRVRRERGNRVRTRIRRADAACCGDCDSCRHAAAFVDCVAFYADVTRTATVVVVPPRRVTALFAWSTCTMDRMEQVVRHGDFRVVATAERLRPRTSDDAKWKVLVSLWKVDGDATSREPEMIRLEDRRSPGLEEALSDALALAVRRIDERQQ